MLLQEFGGALMSLDSPSTFHLLIPPALPTAPQTWIWEPWIHLTLRKMSSEQQGQGSALPSSAPTIPWGFLFQQDSGFIPNKLLLWGNSPRHG